MSADKTSTEIAPFTCVSRAWSAHETELRRFLSHRLSDAHHAEDLLQDVFIKAMREGKRFCGLDSARAWLFEVARNVAVDHFRKQRELVDVPDDLVAETDEREVIDVMTICLPRALPELPDEDREAILLCDLQGMKQEDFARLKGLSLSGAKSRVQRARKRLRDHLTQACQVQYDEQGRVCGFIPRHT
ncbi:MAG: RNA polymerase sigma factor SigZ [Oxalobacter sp.]|nr:MAG: RNA polymerase sigma factor SigZ [Oxalobacter sp.]